MVKGAFWEKVSGKGDKYYSGVLDIDDKKVDVVLFIQKVKKTEKSPDLTLIESKPLDKKEDEAF
jgi:hypothetical protein